jgi:hypothetical protein
MRSDRPPAVRGGAGFPRLVRGDRPAADLGLACPSRRRRQAARRGRHRIPNRCRPSPAQHDRGAGCERTKLLWWTIVDDLPWTEIGKRLRLSTKTATCRAVEAIAALALWRADLPVPPAPVTRPRIEPDAGDCQRGYECVHYGIVCSGRKAGHLVSRGRLPDLPHSCLCHLERVRRIETICVCCVTPAATAPVRAPVPAPGVGVTSADRLMRLLKMIC